MQAHLMQLYMKWTVVLNPGQTPVDVSDQPVYALTKELQFRHPEMFSQFFPIFGQLHIEQSLLVFHGQLIERSGLVQILTENKSFMIGLSVVVDKLHYVHFLSNFVRLCPSVKPICHHIFSLHKNQKIIYRFCTGSVLLIWK